VQHRRLAGTRGAGQRDEAAVLDGEADVVGGSHRLAAACSVVLADAAELDDGVLPGGGADGIGAGHGSLLGE
jgi:hypothetical protein